ncbi:MAG: FAD-dependent oxidoreductase [Chromatiales bacterium]|nr:FAD-dependent oxidoreductase [Chromatiales bacterium]
MRQIVIVGSGFGACTAVRRLRKRGWREDIAVVAPAPELFYFPSLIWVPYGRRDERSLRIDLSGFFRRHDVRFHAARATGLDAESRTLKTDAGDLRYDDLIIASGGRYLRKLPGIENAHIVCAGWAPTKAWSDAFAGMDGGRLAFGFAGNPNEPSAMRGGPVFEFLFGIDTWLRKQGRRDRFELTFFSPAPRPGARMGEKAVDRLLGEMSRRDIRTHLGHKLKGFAPGRVETEGGGFDTDLILFIPGMTGPDWAADSGLVLSEGGFIKADAQCRSEGQDHVFVAGDAGSFPGPDWKPKQAHMADLQAIAAVDNLLAQAAGRSATETFRTELICIVDSVTSGTLVYRDSKRAFQTRGPHLHWAKSLFEWNYLRPYRARS